MKKLAIALTTALLMIGSAHAAEPTNNPNPNNGGKLDNGPVVTVAAVTAMFVAAAVTDDDKNGVTIGTTTTSTGTGTGTTTTSTSTGTGTTTTSVTN